MNKTLKPYTIIPPNLYVRRDADRQLENIIKDMGRPGYVLVSRQMGKTNLLLNAKREFETKDDVYVYIDLSNPFETEKSCFENIINTAIETSKEKLLNASVLIKKLRQNSVDVPVHKAHVDELRMILNNIPGKLVVILDEIDALTRNNYSDRVFAQIRSIYFSRTNFPELNRLTYILSGVIEPTEIIKDPKISPFNIGQKIFLNDFSMGEFEAFLLQSNLNLKDDIRDRVFYWAKGHPRITWDVCSEIENIPQTTAISIKDVDNIIKTTYLTSYDKPPVDNIRELVKNDVELRSAIIELSYHKGNVISDKIRNKLYLAGVINHDNDNINIKNEVLKLALNTEWIQTVEIEEKGLVKIACELYYKDNYAEALKTFEKYLQNNQFSSSESSYYYFMGSCAYYTSELDKALKYLNLAKFDKEDESKLFYATLHLKGLTYYYLNNIESSLECLKQVLDRNKKDEVYARALINFGSIALKSNKSDYISKAKQIFTEIIESKSIDSVNINNELLNELKSISHFNLAQILNTATDKTVAIDHYRKAILFAKNETKPLMFLTLFSALDKELEQETVLQSLVELIVDNGVRPQKFDYEKPVNFTFDQYKDILLILYFHKKDTLFKGIVKTINCLGEKSYAKHLFDLAIYSMSKNSDWNNAMAIFDDLIKNKNNADYQVDNEVYYSALKLFVYSSVIKRNFDRAFEFIELFQSNVQREVELLDIEIFAFLIHSLIEKKKYEDALHYIEITKQFKTRVPDKFYINYLVLMNQELNTYLYLKNNDKALEVADRIIELANDDKIKLQKSNLLGETGVVTIKQNAETCIIQNRHKLIPIRTALRYGRNEFVKVKYRDGAIINKKFKKVEDDIKAGLCVVVEVATKKNGS